MKRQKQSSSGRTALEILAVLAIMGTMSAGVYGMAANVMNERRTMDTIAQIHNLATLIQDAFSWTDSYAINNSVNQGVYGSTYSTITDYLIGQEILDDNDLKLASGHTVTLSSTAASGSTPSYFTIKIPSADYSICQAVALEDWSDRLVSLKIASTTFAVTVTNGVTTDSRPPLALGTTVANCPKNSSKNLELTFK